jgi:hypothetical protein
MRWLSVVILALTPACPPTEAPPSALYAKERIGFDVTRDPSVSGQCIASGSHVDGQGVNPDGIKRHTLLKRMENARNDSYDLVVWSGPATSALASGKL